MIRAPGPSGSDKASSDTVPMILKETCYDGGETHFARKTANDRLATVRHRRVLLHDASHDSPRQETLIDMALSISNSRPAKTAGSYAVFHLNGLCVSRESL